MAEYFSGVAVAQLDSDFRWSPTRGASEIKRWRGSLALLSTYQQQARALKYAHATRKDGPYYVLEVEFPEDENQSPDEPLSETWEVDTNLLQKDIWSLPRIQTELQKIGSNAGVEGPAIRAFWKADFEAFLDGTNSGKNPDGTEYDITLATLLDVAGLYGADTTIIAQLFSDMADGVKTYRVRQFVLRHTKVTTISSNIKTSRENVDRIYTAESILALLPQDVKFQLPESGFFLKNEPTVEQIEKGRWRIEQEYEHADSYAFTIYGNPVA